MWLSKIIERILKLSSKWQWCSLSVINNQSNFQQIVCTIKNQQFPFYHLWVIWYNGCQLTKTYNHQWSVRAAGHRWWMIYQVHNGLTAVPSRSRRRLDQQHLNNKAWPLSCDITVERLRAASKTWLESYEYLFTILQRQFFLHIIRI